MALFVPNEAEKNILDGLQAAAGHVLKLCLFKNDVQPGANTTKADLTEATFDGYGRKQGFGAAATDANGKGYTALLNQTWTKAAGQNNETIYGYYVLHTHDQVENLIAVERFAVPRPMDAVGNSITLSVTLTLREDS